MVAARTRIVIFLVFCIPVPAVGAQSYKFSASSTSVARGSSVTFTCDTPDVNDLNWYYAGPPVRIYTVVDVQPGPDCTSIGAIPDSFSVTCSQSARTFTLTINDITCQNAGSWRCQDRGFGLQFSNSETITVTDIKLFADPEESTGMFSDPAPTTAGFETVFKVNVNLSQSTNVTCEAGGIRKTILIDVSNSTGQSSPPPCLASGVDADIVIACLVTIVSIIVIP